MKRVLVSLLASCLAACGSPSGGPIPSCAAVCANLRSAGCSGVAPNCESRCESELSGMPAGCDRELDALLACASVARVTCEADGSALVWGCGSQDRAAGQCVDSAQRSSSSCSDAEPSFSETVCGQLPGDLRLRICDFGSPDASCVSLQSLRPGWYCCPR